MAIEYKVGEIFMLKQDPSTLGAGEISKVRPFIITSRYKSKKTGEIFLVLSPCTTSYNQLNFKGAVLIDIRNKASIIRLGQPAKQYVMKASKFIGFRNKYFIGKLSELDILNLWEAIDNYQTCIDPKTGQVRGHSYFKPAHEIERLYENKINTFEEIFSILNILNENIV